MVELISEGDYMSLIEKMNMGDKFLYSNGYFSGDYNQELYLKRAFNDSSNRPKYYISVFSNINGEMVQQGYIYFYLDSETKSSDFIGVGVEPKYRNLNIGSLLVASWIDLCLNNGYDFLGANKKQRKPFLLYLLKTYGFEIFDKTLYDTRKDVISICKSEDVSDKRKLLLFKDLKHEKSFLDTNVCKHDNYEVIHSKQGIIVLDDIILPLQGMKKDGVKYELLDSDKAEDKTKKVIARHKR